MKTLDRKKEYGQDLMEYAIIFPVLFLILIGIFDLGRVVYYYSSLSNAAREGVRWGIIHPEDDTAITTRVCNSAIGLDLGCPNPNITITWFDKDGNSITRNSNNLRIARDIQVKVTYYFEPVNPLISYLLKLGQGDSLALDGQSIMRIEH